MIDIKDFYVLETDELAAIPVLRFYCSGTDQSLEDDESYQAAVRAEIADVEEGIAGIGPFKTIGIGGAGDDFVRAAELVGALYALLRMPGAAHDAAMRLRDAWRRIRQARLTTWRISREALILECCEQLREELGIDFVPDCDDISVTRLRTQEYEFTYTPEAEFLITIPRAAANCTHVFRADTAFNVSKLATLEGLPDNVRKKSRA